MSDHTGVNFIIFEQRGKILALIAAGLLSLCLLLFILLHVYLATPLPARQLSRLVTSSLRQDFTVERIALSGRTLILRKVRLHNPKGFAGPDLVAAESVAIRPQWLQLLRGRQRFDDIAIDGGKVNLLKNSGGVWNFSELQRRLAARKPTARPAVETVIGELLVRNGDLAVEGQGVRGINLKLYNLTSGGSRSAQVELAFEDPAHNRYQLQGTARPGAQAAVDLTLSAPMLSLRQVAELLKLRNPQALEKATGSLTVNAVLAKGELRSSGSFRFGNVLLPAARGSYPVAGTLQFNGYYSAAEDRADLTEATLDIRNVAQLHAEGDLSGVTRERRFALLFAVDQVDLALMNVLLTEQSRRGLLLGGKVRCESLRLEGSGAQGVESATGTLQLSDGSIAGKDELLVTGLSGQVGLSRKGNAVAVAGRLTSAQGGKAVVGALRLPFDVTLSSKLKPLRALISGGSARVYGVPVAGDLSYDTGRPEPLAASLKVPEASLVSLNPFLKRHGVEAGAGTASGSVTLAGKGGQEFKASGALRLSGFTGKRGAEPFGIKDGAATVELLMQGGHRQASGEARLAGLHFKGKGGEARFGYRVVDQRVTLEELQARLGTARFAAARLTGQLPPKAGAAGRTPLLVELEGGGWRQGDLELSGLAGRLRADMVVAGAERWLEGTAELSSKSLVTQGTGVGAPLLQASFARAGARAELGGRLLGGKLDGQATFRPFVSGSSVNFRASLSGAAAAQAARLLPKTATARPTGGQLDLRLDGVHSAKGGLDCRFDAKGRNLSLARNGKSVLNGASLFLSGSYAAGTLAIGEGLFSPGKGVAIRARGQVAAALSPKRRGTVTFSLPETPLESVLDASINLVPPAIQEATIKGSISAQGTLELREGRQLLEGSLDLRGAKVESAPQKLAVSDIEGRIPISLDLAGKSAAQPKDSREFSRANYRRLREQLAALPAGGDTVTVGRIAFGNLEMGKTTLQLRASNGLMEIAPLRTTLYDGAILGTGYLSMRDQPTYRADLLVDGLSLKRLCRSIPGVQGYISGRVDGVLSFRGVGGSVTGMTGFVDLWARQGKDEMMLVSKEFLQRLAKQKLSGFFLSSDRPYDEAEIKATLQEGDLTFSTLKIVNTNLFGVKDLNVNIAPTQNRIGLTHLMESIKEAAVRGTPATGAPEPKKGAAKPEPMPEFRWEE